MSNYSPGFIRFRKGGLLVAGALDRTLPAFEYLNHGDMVVEDTSLGYSAWRLAGSAKDLAGSDAGNADAALQVYVVQTPTDAVAGAGGTAFSAEGVGRRAGLGKIYKPSLIDGLTSGPLQGTPSAGTTPAASNPYGTNRANVTTGTAPDTVTTTYIAAGHYIVTAIPMYMPGYVYEISQYAATTTLSVNDTVDVSSSNPGCLTGPAVDDSDNDVGRWRVVNLGNAYQNNKTIKTVANEIVRQGGMTNTVTVVFDPPPPATVVVVAPEDPGDGGGGGDPEDPGDGGGGGDPEDPGDDGGGGDPEDPGDGGGEG